MRLAALIAALLVTSTAYADRDPDFEAGLSSVPIEGNPVLPGPQYARPQLITRDTTTAKTVGTIAAVGGSLSLVAGWVVYVARQNHRLQPRLELGDSVSKWETLGGWSATLTGFGAANIVASEYLLLDGKTIPTLAWISGAVGVGVAAVGAGFLLGGEACAPLALQPGSVFPVGCMSGTADRMFGVNLLMSSAALLNLPLSYAVRGLFAGAPESLTLGPSGVQWSGRF